MNDLKFTGSLSLIGSPYSVKSESVIYFFLFKVAIYAKKNRKRRCRCRCAYLYDCVRKGMHVEVVL